MHQPTASRGRVGIIGAGRAGRVLGRALQIAGHEVVAIHSRSAEGRAQAAAALGIDATADPREVLRAADVVLLCAPDTALPALAVELATVDCDHAIRFVVVSGSVPLADLDVLATRGHEVLRMHPLRALTPGSTPEDLVGAPAAVAASTADACRSIYEIARSIGLEPFDLAERDVATWHAAATVAANHSVALVATARDLGVLAGLEPDDALAAFGGLALQAVGRALEEGPEVALTGPASRGDAGTIVSHLGALRRVAPRHVPAYRELALEATRIARGSGRLDHAQEQALGGALDAQAPIVVETVVQLRAALDDARRLGLRIGFVPTMGALHAGHAQLVRTARAECDVVVVSCFVNPTQFGPGEDLDRYPHTPELDEQVVAEAGGDILWRPAVRDIYGDEQTGATGIQVGAIGRVLEGASRPGHFDGVASVVVRLLGVVAPAALYLGAKDFQQVAVLRRVVDDLAIDVDVRVVDTVREPDGLARSSRNAYLSADERVAARAIPAALDLARDQLADGERRAAPLRDAVLARLAQEPLVEVDYVAIVDPASLEPIATEATEAMVLVAVRVGRTRLIDNTRLVAARQEALA